MTQMDRRAFLTRVGLGGAAMVSGLAFAPAPSHLATATAALSDAAAGAMPLKLARVWVDRRTAHLLTGFDDTHVVFDDGSVELLLWPGDQQRLQRTGLRHEITVQDVQARDAGKDLRGTRPAGLGAVPGETEDGTYRDLDAFNAEMMALAERYPDTCELFEMPEQSLQGRTVYGLEICEDVTRRDGRPVYYNDGVHHAREWPAAEVPMMWAIDLLEAYERVRGGVAGSAEGSTRLDDMRLAHLVRNVRNVVVPVVNVDGYAYSRYGPLGTGRDVFDQSATAFLLPAPMQYWRKNMRAIDPALNGSPVDGVLPQNGILPTTPGALGVDNNRNYSYRWGGDGSGGTIDSGTYRGETPFSEPESRNVAWVHERLQCVAGITHHTSGNLVLWAWGDTRDDAPDDALLARLGFAMGDYVQYRPTKSIDLYVTTGTCSDWMYGTFGSVSYTFEHAGSSFHPPYLEVVPQFYANNRKAFMLMAELICLEPKQRYWMKAALARDLDTVTRNETDTLRTHLFGSFEEALSNGNYVYDESSALDLDGRYNCVVTGRLVDGRGRGVAGTVRNVKVFANPLTPGNPIGEDDHPAAWDATIVTDAKGRFRWTIYPTTAPAREFAGELESVTLEFASPGVGTARREVTLRRGEVLDLKKVRLR